MGFYNFLSERIILPTSDIALGLSIRKTLDFLFKSQYWQRQQIDDYQNMKLQKLVRHAYTNVPYYNSLFKKLKLTPEDIKTKSDLLKLPILTKEEIKNNFPERFIARNLPSKSMVYESSSGSTGEPFQFYKTKISETYSKASAIRAWYWMGYRLGDSYAKLSMNARSTCSKKMQDKVNRCTYLYSQQLIKSNFDVIINEILRIQPHFLRSYPAPLVFLVSQAEERGLLNQFSFMKAVTTTGSTLHTRHRKYIENTLNLKIYDSYSCEGGGIVSECENRYNYHSTEEYSITEFMEDNFTKNDHDKACRLITTDLHNYAVPFIRYDTQDYVVPDRSGEVCPCGRHLLAIKKIKGRDGDILVTPTGKNLIVENFVAYFEWIDSVEQIQVVQNKLDEIIFNLVVNKRFNEKIKNDIQNYWMEYIGNDVRVKIVLCDELKLTPTGKRRIVIRNPELRLSKLFE